MIQQTVRVHPGNQEVSTQTTGYFIQQTLDNKREQNKPNELKLALIPKTVK